VRLSALRAGRPLPPGTFLILISVRGWVDPRDTVRLEELGRFEKNPPYRDSNPLPSGLLHSAATNCATACPSSEGSPLDLHSEVFGWFFMDSLQANVEIISQFTTASFQMFSNSSSHHPTQFSLDTDSHKVPTQKNVFVGEINLLTYF
jgi:hypothetical protein